MAQLSIFEKQRHFSDKDLTVSVGKYDTIYITFRHDSWKRFTDSDYIAVVIKDNVLIFGDPDERISWVHFKLKQTHGNPETYEHTRYVQISGKAWPEFLKAARNMVGSFNFDDAPTIKNVSEEDIEKLKELLANAGPTKLEPLEDTVPKGFIEVHGTHDERLLILAKDIQQVCEVVPGARFAPSYLSGDEARANSIIFARTTICTLDTYDELLEKLRRVSEV